MSNKPLMVVGNSGSGLVEWPDVPRIFFSDGILIPKDDGDGDGSIYIASNWINGLCKSSGPVTIPSGTWTHITGWDVGDDAHIVGSTDSIQVVNTGDGNGESYGGFVIDARVHWTDTPADVRLIEACGAPGGVPEAPSPGSFDAMFPPLLSAFASMENPLTYHGYTPNGPGDASYMSLFVKQSSGSDKTIDAAFIRLRRVQSNFFP